MINSHSLNLRQIILRVLLMFLVWRCSLFLFDFFGLSLTQERAINDNKDWQAFRDLYFFDSFFRWDGGWYNRIVQKGYYLEGSQSNVAFYPLYPYLSRWLGYIVGNHFVAGWLISNFSLIGGLVYLYRIGLLYFDRQTVERSLVLLLIFPSSLFFSTFYTEGLFLLTCTSSFYYFLNQQYFRAGLYGILATLTRSTGILLWVSFLVDLLYYSWRKKQSLRLEMAWLCLIPLGLLIFAIILYVQVGDPTAFISIQKGWNRESMFPLTTIWQTLTKLDYRFPRNAGNIQLLFDLISTLVFLGISLLMALRKERLSLWLFVMLGVLLPLSTGTMDSMMRYCAVLFPAFLYLGWLARKPIIYQYFIFSFGFFLSIYSLLYMNWFWAG